MGSLCTLGSSTTLVGAPSEVSAPPSDVDDDTDALPGHLRGAVPSVGQRFVDA
jgi:hypothetical protein